MTTISKITLDNLNIKTSPNYIKYNKNIINNLVVELNKENLYIEDDLLRYPLYDDMDNILSCIRDSNRDYNSMKFISTLLYYICSYDKNTQYRTYKFRTFLHNLEFMSYYYSISYIEFFNTKDLLLIKHNTNMYYEFIIGKVLNNLRKDIPNFIYTFIINSCSVTNKFYKKIKNNDYINNINIICPFYNTILKSNYVKDSSIIIEQFKGESLQEFLEIATLQEFYDIILQTCLALNYAYDKYKFTHYDLHSGNVIIDKRNYKSTYKYKYENQDVYLTTNILVSIINFGRSYIKYNEMNIFDDSINSIGCSFILYDFLLLMGSCKFQIQNNNPIYKFIVEILKTFLDEKFINTSYKDFKKIKYEKHLAGINYDHIISVLKNIAEDYKLSTKLNSELNDYSLVNSNISVCLKEINSFLSRHYIEFNDCMGFYDFYLKFKDDIIYNDKNKILFKYYKNFTTSGYLLNILNNNDQKLTIHTVHFKYIDCINNDIKYLENFIPLFINFLKELYYDYDYVLVENQKSGNLIIESFFLNFPYTEDNNYNLHTIKHFIIDNEKMIRYTSKTILNVINTIHFINNNLLSEYKNKINSIINKMNSINFIRKLPKIY